ncbi:MAG: hypothetical protein MI747_12920, partial [Desulfobacterales bacterium]|nr:hypothetical protein [Desulfobacterales bacterium]
MILYHRNLRLLTASVMAVFIAATHTPAAEPALSTPVTELETLTVTAGKRQCTARDFPGSISVR